MEHLTDHNATSATPELERLSGRFTRAFLTILLGGLASSIAVALLVDPFGVFGTGRIPSDVVNEREVKPELFLRASTPPQAIILGSSRVEKFSPTCITELSGVPAFNFGIASGNVEDWDAILRFITDHGRAPLRKVLIGIDIDAFDNHSSRQLELSTYLREYTANPGLSWAEVTRGLFGEQSFKHGLYLIWTQIRAQDYPPDFIGSDGLRIEPGRDARIRNGTYSFKNATDQQLRKFKRRALDRFDELNPVRVKLFQDLVRHAHAAGVTIEVFVPPMSSTLDAARAFSQIPQRTAELDQILEQLEQAGSLRYHRFAKVEDLRDPAAFVDGVHPTEATSTRVLLRVFNREHGCGL